MTTTQREQYRTMPTTNYPGCEDENQSHSFASLEEYFVVVSNENNCDGSDRQQQYRMTNYSILSVSVDFIVINKPFDMKIDGVNQEGIEDSAQVSERTYEEPLSRLLLKITTRSKANDIAGIQFTRFAHSLYFITALHCGHLGAVEFSSSDQTNSYRVERPKSERLYASLQTLPFLSPARSRNKRGDAVRSEQEGCSQRHERIRRAANRKNI